MRDPNLVKIKDTNLKQIRRGHTQTAEEQAWDYLNYILGPYQSRQIKQEFQEFRENIRTIAQ